MGKIFNLCTFLFSTANQGLKLASDYFRNIEYIVNQGKINGQYSSDISTTLSNDWH